MSQIMTCIDAEGTRPANILKLGHDYLVDIDEVQGFCYVWIDSMKYNLFSKRFAPVSSAMAKAAKRVRDGKQGGYQDAEPAGEDIQDTKRYALKSDKQLMQVMREDLLSDDEFRGAMKFNIFKYGVRYPEKNGVADLEKARVYIDELIDFEKEKENENV